MKPLYQLNAKHMGIILISISAALFLTFLSSTYEIMKAADIQCEQVCGPDMHEDCPHKNGIPLQSYFGFTITIITLIIGINTLLSERSYSEKERKIERQISKLHGDEKQVFNLIMENDGAMFQSEIIEKTGFSKARVSRILDRLEIKGLIDKRRRGMTNLIVLKK